jgi:diketogulonate reductase-like aldo/keto reductase
LRDEGVIRAVGVTNFDSAHLRVALASGIHIASNQISYSLIDRRASGRMARSAWSTESRSWRTDRLGWLPLRSMARPP